MNLTQESPQARWNAECMNADADALVDSLLRLCKRESLFAPGDRLLVGVSGGQDSCALLHALCGLRATWSIEVSAAHLNHGFRGAESDEDEAFVRELCAKLGVTLSTGAMDVPAMAKRLHRSAQEAAREARHGFLQDAAEQAGAGKIALGHTQDDHLETILVNIVRGCGVDGLTGIPAASGTVIRPLREVSRTETERYCREQGIAFRVDASNRSPKYLRNRVRTELLPQLRAYNPGVGGALARLSEIAAAESEFMEGAALDALLRARRIRGGLEVPTAALHPFGPEIGMLRRIVRAAIREVRGDLYDVSFEAVDSLATAIRTGGSASRTLAHGDVIVTANRDGLTVRTAEPQLCEVPTAVPVSISGVTRAGGFGCKVTSMQCAPVVEQPESRSASTLVVDADRLAGPVVLRNRRPGDRIQPPGMVGRRKLQDILVDAGVPRSERGRAPILADDLGPFWVVGHLFDDRVRVRAGTNRAVKFEVTFES